MAVHDLSASDLVVDKAGWQPMDTFPKDAVAEVIDVNGEIGHAMWTHNKVSPSKMWMTSLTGWRKME